MKIIKQEDPSVWKYSFTCRKCNAELEADMNDIKYSFYEGDCREPSSESFSLNCAVCNESHHLNIKNLPVSVQLKAKEKRNYSSAAGYYYYR